MNTTKDTCVALLAFAALAALPAVAGVKYWDNPAFKAYDVGDYVQDGLVLHYDGLRNAGAEADHSDTTDTWVNLASDGAYPMGWCSWILNSADSKYYIRNGNTESGSWAANGFVFDGTAVFAATNITFGIGATYTHQLVMTASTADLKDENGTTGYIFRPGKSWENNAIAIRQTSNGSTTPENAVYVIDRTRFGANTPRANFSNANPRYATVLSDSDAIRIFEGTEIPTASTGGNSYKAGSRTTTDNNSWFAYGAQFDGSPRSPRNNLQAFNGTLHAARYYSKALSEEDLAWNRVIDEYRFFGASAPIPVTNVVVATSVAGADGDQPCGAYALDAEGFTFTARAQQAVNGKRHVLGGYTLETWNGTAWVADGEGTHTGSSVELSGTAAIIRLTWQYAPAAGEGQLKTYGVGDYVAGAVIHYDGILNQGVGQPHAAAATTWVNLGSEGAAYDLTLKDSSGNLIAATGGDAGTWTDDGFAYVGKSRFNCTTARTWGPDYTIQVLADANRSSLKAKNAANYIFATGWNQCALAYYETSSRGIELHTQGAPSGSPHYGPFLPLATLTYATATLDGDNRRATIFTGTEVPTDASLTGVTNYAAAINSYSSGFNVGGWGGGGSTGANFLVGTLKNLRVYDRVLTDAELAQNRKVDEYRFFGRYAEPNVVVQSTYSYLEGYDKCGDYEVDGSYTFVAPETVTAPNGITYAPDGYTVETWDGAKWTGATTGSGSSYLYNIASGTIRLTWKWKATQGLRSAADYDFEDYAAGGLKIHLDGIFNAGVGNARTTANTTNAKWVNLGSNGAESNASLTKGSDASAWTDDGYYFDGKSKFTIANIGVKAGQSYTLQLLADVDRSVQNLDGEGNAQHDYFFSGTYNGLAVSVYGHGKPYLRAGADVNFNLAEGERLTYFTGIMDQNGASPVAYAFPGTTPASGTTSTAAGLTTPTVNNPALGGWGGGTSQYGIGTIKNVRFYDRVLTEEELIRNRNVDSARYFGELGVTNLVVEIEEGETMTVTPAPGAYFVEGSYDFSVQTRGSDNRFSYKLQRWDAENEHWAYVRSAPGTEYTHVVADAPAAMMKLTWRRQQPFVLVVR